MAPATPATTGTTMPSSSGAAVVLGFVVGLITHLFGHAHLWDRLNSMSPDSRSVTTLNLPFFSDISHTSDTMAIQLPLNEKKIESVQYKKLYIM